MSGGGSALGGSYSKVRSVLSRNRICLVLLPNACLFSRRMRKRVFDPSIMVIVSPSVTAMTLPEISPGKSLQGTNKRNVRKSSVFMPCRYKKRVHSMSAPRPSPPRLPTIAQTMKCTVYAHGTRRVHDCWAVSKVVVRTCSPRLCFYFQFHFKIRFIPP